MHQGLSVCRDCLSKLESGEKIEGLQAQIQSQISASSAPDTMNRFKTVLRYGKFFSGLGWVLVILGIVAIIGGLASDSEAGMAIAAGAFILIISGIGMLVSGQLISCIVAIENNTRAIYALLRQKPS